MAAWEHGGRNGADDVRRRRSLMGPAALHAAAESGLAATICGGARGYDRALALPRLIALDPRELSGDGPELRRRIVTRLTRALRTERQRGRAGHWTYDLNRHIALLQALQAETDGRRRGPGPNAADPPTRFVSRLPVGTVHL